MIITSLALLGCSWNTLPSGPYDTFTDAPLWDADGAVATSAGLYARLPWAGGLVRIRQNGQVDPIDFGPRRVTRIAAAPDGDTLVAFVDAYTCSPDDRREARNLERIADCSDDDLEITSTIQLVRGTTTEGTDPVPGAYNAVEFSTDGRFGVAYISDFDDVNLNGVVNLNGIAVLDLQDGRSDVVTVGFAPDRVLFNTDAAGVATSAVVLSRNRVANVDLSERPYAITQFPLTLDPDVIRDPTGIDLTPDGRYALISTRGTPDLYVIDLVDESINIIDLESAPSTLQVDDNADRTVLVYANQPVVELMEHDFFTVDRLALDEGMSRVLTRDGSALLWGDGDQHDVYRLDLETQDLVEYTIQNPAVSMHIAPTGEFAVVLTRPENGQSGGVDGLYDANPGMEILDLSDDESVPFLLEGQGVGAAFVPSPTSLVTLVLQQGIDYLLAYDLYSGDAEEIELAAPPRAIGTLPGASRFYITHDSPLGFVSFYDPETGSLTEVSGFAAEGLLDPVQFAEDPEVAR